MTKKNIKCHDAFDFFNFQDVEVINASSFMFMQKTSVLDIKIDITGGDERCY